MFIYKNNNKYKMDVRRRLRKNKINNDIRDTKICITRSEDAIKRIRLSNMGEVFVRNQMDKLNEVITEKKLLMENLTSDKLELEQGELDEEINKEYDDNAVKREKFKKEQKKNSVIKKIEKKEKKEVSDEYWKGIVAASRSHRQKERDVNYAQKYYDKIVDSLPAYMKSNLAEMPNNKGYIWRGVYFYGYLPEQSSDLRVIFEKQRGGLLIIHEYTDREYRRYEKDGKNRKQLVHKSLKKEKQVGTSIMDYVKK